MTLSLRTIRAICAAAALLVPECPGGESPEARVGVKLGWIVQPSNVVSGVLMSPSVQVTVQDTAGNGVPVTAGTISVSITGETGTPGAILGGTLTRPVMNGTATFENLTVDKQGVGYKLTATSEGLPSATSNAFDNTFSSSLVWSTVPSGTLQDLAAVWGSSPSDIWAVGQSGIVHYDGSAWSTVSPTTLPAGTNQLFDVWGTSPTNVWVVGYAGQLLHYDGSTWSKIPTATSASLFALWGSSAADVWAVGDAGLIFHFDGTSWTKVSTGIPGNFRGVWGSSPSSVWVVGGGGRVIHYDGTAWSDVPIGSAADHWDVWGSSPADIWVAANQKLLHYNGTAWSEFHGGASVTISKISGSSAAKIWGISGYGGTNIYEYNGEAWIAIAAPTIHGLNDIWGSSPSSMWVVGRNGTILRGRPPV
jgi:hypothetical protein